MGHSCDKWRVTWLCQSHPRESFLQIFALQHKWDDKALNMDRKLYHLERINGTTTPFGLSPLTNRHLLGAAPRHFYCANRFLDAQSCLSPDPKPRFRRSYWWDHCLTLTTAAHTAVTPKIAGDLENTFRLWRCVILIVFTSLVNLYESICVCFLFFLTRSTIHTSCGKPSALSR